MAKKKAAKKKTAKKKVPLRSAGPGASRGRKKQAVKSPAAAPKTKTSKRKAASGRATAAKSSKVSKPAPKPRGTKKQAATKKPGGAAHKVSQARPSPAKPSPPKSSRAKVSGRKPPKKPGKSTAPSTARSQAKAVPQTPPTVGEGGTPDPANIDAGKVDTANVPEGPERAPEDLDFARRHTTIRDESEEEGYGRSEGPAARRLSQMGEYPADDDELQYGRNLTGRNRIPGAGSKRNQ